MYIQASSREDPYLEGDEDMNMRRVAGDPGGVLFEGDDTRAREGDNVGEE